MLKGNVDVSSFEQLSETYVDMINDMLESYIIKTGEPYDIVKEAMHYSLTAGGKRIRPILVLEFCRMLGGDIQKALPFACAVEIIHCYSLIHDDLPCMDDDDLRRGRPSCHKQFDEATALLAGDALLTLAFEAVASASNIDMLGAEPCINAVKTLAVCSGADGMVGGQILDLLNENKKIDEQTLNITHMKKTAALIKAACKLGAIAANATEEVAKQCDKFGQELGMAFQIVDDILDVTGNSKDLGKPVGRDSENNKTTYVTLYGIQSAERIARDMTTRAMEILDNFNNNEYLKALTQKLLLRKN